ncbi:hypothetical protein L1987_06504 [Smallanthus sonchifolius]|uniref:Uncharacterized protein n=1 Tax=Smallanthus sonchifolius TaxID=185202 RepID=A0ACB9JYB1_9ASTR|nr:hypothetical protein L1987_06504 [Smallanthus sonchifolius]
MISFLFSFLKVQYLVKKLLKSNGNVASSIFTSVENRNETLPCGKGLWRLDPTVYHAREQQKRDLRVGLLTDLMEPNVSDLVPELLGCFLVLIHRPEIDIELKVFPADVLDFQASPWSPIWCFILG